MGHGGQVVLFILLAACSGHAVRIQGAHLYLRLAANVQVVANRSYNLAPCGVPQPTTQTSDMEERCPTKCPLYVDQKKDDMTCTFTCVGNSADICIQANPETPVPDLEAGECRRCNVFACDECLSDGTDSCHVCLPGYKVNSEGQCSPSVFLMVSGYLLYMFLAIVAVGIIFVIWWMVDLGNRNEVNPKALKHGLNTRSRAKLHQPKEANQPRKLFDLNTNLCSEDAAGPAVMLLFNFQRAIIIWAAVLAMVWFCLGFVEPELAILGTRPQETARQACINVKWGYDTMHRLMWAKIGYLEFAYIFSFIGAIIFGIRQRRLYDTEGLERSTHKDFALILHGLPAIPGTERVEEDLKAAVMEATKECPVGVSVGWQVDADSQELFGAALTSRLNDIREERRKKKQEEDTSAEEDANDDEECSVPDSKLWTHIFLRIETFFVSPTTQKILSRGRRKAGMSSKEKKGQTSASSVLLTPVTPEEDPVEAALLSLNTSTTAFAVFETERARDNAAKACEAVAMKFKEKTLQVEVPDYEPSAVLWQNLVPERTTKAQCMRCLGLLCFVAMMITMLGLFEYMYYKVQVKNVVETGTEAMNLSFFLSTGLVCGMMAALCICSAEISDRYGFERVGAREACFVILYAFSVILQVSCDLVIAYLVGIHLMEINDMRTYDGRKIEDMHWQTDFVDVFETYAIQKHMGVTVLSFGFPAAFLLPFLAEPIISIFLPYKIMTLLIRTHKEIKPQDAEGYLEAVPMDLGRYGDIVINVIVASLILWFPGGFTFKIFMLFTLSSIYIYCYDHYRLLRSVNTIYISTFNVDWWAQWLFCIPCSIIVAALAFKSNCKPEFSTLILPTTQLHHLGLWGSECDEGLGIIAKVLITFFAHLVLHTLLLLFFVPLFRSSAETSAETAQTQYSEVAKAFPSSWFSANLVHCLRSDYIYAHSPPFDYCVSGKEHLMRSNAEIGAYFEDQKAGIEVYDNKENFRSMRESLGEFTFTSSDPLGKS